MVVYANTLWGLCRTMTLFSTSFVVAPHCTAGMPFAIGIPLGEMGVSNAKVSKKYVS